MTEIWKDIIGFEHYYQISNLGRVKRKERTSINGRLQKEKILSPYYNKGGYRYINFQVGGVKTRYAIHRLIAIHFIPNPNNYPIINHKNEIKDDNRIENLEWCTYSYNLSYGHRVENMFKTRTENKTVTAQKQVIQYDLQDNVIAEFSSISEASRATNISCGSIWQSCNLGCVTNKLYKWKYKQ